MSDRAPQLDIAPATLHAPTGREPHVDSEEAVQYERRRVSRELDPICHQDSSRRISNALHTPRTEASLRSRNASLLDTIASQEHIRRASSNLSTQPDVPGASATGAQSTRSSVREPHWYDPVTKFWRTHISLSIDEGAHRDHLGTSPTLYFLYATLTCSSPRAHLPRLPPHLAHSRHNRRHNRATLPSSTHRGPGSAFRLLRYWPTAKYCVHWHGDLGGVSWRD
jgi:hypothetical protein